MTLKEYIRTFPDSITHIGCVLGVTDHAVRKWAYGQREPDIETAVKIVGLTGGLVTISELSKQVAAAREQAA